MPDRNQGFYPQKGETYYAKWEKNKYTVTLDNNGHGESLMLCLLLNMVLLLLTCLS